MKKLKYTKHEDAVLQNLINKEKPNNKYMASNFDGNVLFIHGWEEELENEKFGEPL